jgi:hypothetical protein
MSTYHRALGTILICKNKSTSQVYKKNYKKFETRGPFLLAKNINEAGDLLKGYSKSRAQGYVGILFDGYQVLADPTIYPMPIKNATILCLESQIVGYPQVAETSPDWVRTQVEKSGHFLVSNDRLNEVAKILKISKDLGHFWEQVKDLSWCSVYSLRSKGVTESVTNRVHDPLIRFSNEKLLGAHLVKIQEGYATGLKLQIEPKLQITDLCKPLVEKTITSGDLPKLSFLTYIDDIESDKFFNVVITFCKLQYPRDLCELVVVNVSGVDSIPSDLPNDDRIKMVTVKIRNGNKGKPSLGAILNTGVQHASHPVIQHLFENTVYTDTNFKNKTFKFSSSGFQCLIQSDSGFPVANMMYLKNFAENNPFEESLYLPENGLVYKFVKDRLKMCSRLSPGLDSFDIRDEYNLESCTDPDVRDWLEFLKNKM